MTPEKMSERNIRLLDHFDEYEKGVLSLNERLVEAVKELAKYAPAEKQFEYECLLEDAAQQPFDEWYQEKRYWESLPSFHYVPYDEDEDISGDEDQQCIMEMIRDYREPDEFPIQEHCKPATPPATVINSEELPF